MAGCLLFLVLPAVDTRVNVLDESNLRVRPYNSKVEVADLEVGLEGLRSIPSTTMHSVHLPGSASPIEVIEVPGSRSPGTEHFIVISVGPSHDVAVALAHSFAHQPFLSVDLRFYLAPPAQDVDTVVGAVGLPVGMLRGGLQLNLTGAPTDKRSICLHSFGVGGLQPNQDLLNVFTSGLQAHGLTSSFLCHTDEDRRAFHGSMMTGEEWFLAAVEGALWTSSIPYPVQEWLTGGMAEHVVSSLSQLVHQAFDLMGGSPRRAGNMQMRVEHLLLYVLEMLRNGRIGAYGGGRMRTNFGTHLVGISDHGLLANPPSPNLSALRVDRGAEYGIRSINNLDERLHHSVPVWLSSSNKNFSDFSVGQIVSFVFAAGCVAIILRTALPAPMGGLPHVLGEGVTSLLVAHAVGYRMMSGFPTPLGSLCMTVTYAACQALLGLCRGPHSHAVPTMHFVPLLVLAVLCTGLEFALVGLNPALSMVGGGVLLTQLLAYAFVSRSGRRAALSSRRPRSSQILRAATRGLICVMVSAVSWGLVLVMSLLLDGDEGPSTRAFLFLSAQLAALTLFANIL
jgi:hypothetical protein